MPAMFTAHAFLFLIGPQGLSDRRLRRAARSSLPVGYHRHVGRPDPLLHLVTHVGTGTALTDAHTQTHKTGPLLNLAAHLNAHTDSRQHPHARRHTHTHTHKQTTDTQSAKCAHNRHPKESLNLSSLARTHTWHPLPAPSSSLHTSPGTYRRTRRTCSGRWASMWAWRETATFTS